MISLNEDGTKPPTEYQYYDSKLLRLIESEEGVVESMKLHVTNFPHSFPRWTPEKITSPSVDDGHIYIGGSMFL